MSYVRELEVVRYSRECSEIRRFAKGILSLPGCFQMPIEIKLKEVSVGYAQTSAQKGENASIIVREFTSSEDGDLFISRLE